MAIPKSINADPNSTDWVIVASDGTCYTTAALMAAAGKVAWPALDAGMGCQSVTAKSLASDGVSNGSAFQIAFNAASAPSTGQHVSGGGQALTLAAGQVEGMRHIYSVWIKASDATDLLNITLDYGN